MQKYIDYAFIWDLIIVIIIGVLLFHYKHIVEIPFSMPSVDNLNAFSISLITISATLMGFLLTIITVIVTFKKGFEDKPKFESKIVQQTEIPNKTIFEKQISKEEQFYGTHIHKKVVDVFIVASYEIGLVLFILLLIQFNIIHFSVYLIAIFSCCLFIILFLSIIRSLYIFKLFLNVHLNDKKGM